MVERILSRQQRETLNKNMLKRCRKEHLYEIETESIVITPDKLVFLLRGDLAYVPFGRTRTYHYLFELEEDME